jgi:hypothetical protein
MRIRNVALLGVPVILLGLVVLLFGLAQITQADNSSFSDPAFQHIWERTDKAVSDGTSTRPWLWGPVPFDARLEPYAQSPNGERQVLYFDKARMEITNPSSDRTNLYYVTNGLLTVELVSGKLQNSDQTFISLAPSTIPVAGDSDDTSGPTYATFTSLASLNNDQAATDHTGQVVNQFIDRQGQISTMPQAPTLATYTHFSPELGHNIPDLFYKWLSGLDVPWEFAMGYPITEAYWTQVKVAGQTKYVLLQLFQRRVLTFTADNPAAFQVEMGNIGRHYWTWRYQSNPPTPIPTTTAGPTATPSPPLFLVSASTDHPNVGSEISITVKLLVNGKAAQGASVHYVFHKKRSSTKCDAVIDQSGSATCLHKVTSSERSFTVNVEVTASYQSQTYTGSVSYQPQ